MATSFSDRMQAVVAIKEKGCLRKIRGNDQALRDPCLKTPLAPGSLAARAISADSQASAMTGFTGYARVRTLKAEARDQGPLLCYHVMTRHVLPATKPEALQAVTLTRFNTHFSLRQFTAVTRKCIGLLEIIIRSNLEYAKLSLSFDHCSQRQSKS